MNDPKELFYSFIIPLYNRPKEIGELLESLAAQNYKNFEVLVIEDGSDEAAEEIVHSFASVLDLHYYVKENSGQGFSRNFAFSRARGDFFIMLDSDILVPAGYLLLVNNAVCTQGLDAFGGPDAAHASFTPVQKAISYAMTSFFTTGGIRGKKQNLGGTFHPRSFNMGISRRVWEQTGGFILTRLGEDIEFSIRMQKAGFRSALIPEAFVYHKRRTNMAAFFRQLHFFGRARVNISLFYPAELKAVHFFPALFTLFSGFIVITLVFHWVLLFNIATSLLLLYATALFIDALFVTKSLYIAYLSLMAGFIQLYAYGIGFITDFFKRRIFK